MPTLIMCRPRSLPREQWVEAARIATRINPANAPQISRLASMTPGIQPTPLRIAAATKKYWGKDGVRLTVGFLDTPSPDLRRRILSHMNAWGKRANVKFLASQVDPAVRIARVTSPPEDAGYWSLLGTDIRSARRDQPTMNLEGFTMKTRDAEFYRVVRHEAGHTLGFEHEHLRAELVRQIDPQKAIAYFRELAGWSEEETRLQVLTPIEESSLLGTTHVDPNSIMCYQIPAAITLNAKPIPGGDDIDERDYEFSGEIYPPKNKPKPARQGGAKGRKRGKAKARS